MARDGRSISFRFGSAQALVHPVVRQAAQFAREFGIDDTSRMSVVLEELLANAIVHGNRNIPDRTVNCRIEHTRQAQFRIVVEDEGEGFDFASLNTSLPENPRALGKRGYVLIRNICTALDFNERGNRVTVLVDVSKDPTTLKETRQ